MSAAPEQVGDYLAICELRAKYSRSIDNENWETYAELFTEDTTVVYPRDTLESRQEVYEYARDRVEYDYSMHTVQMPEIDVDGDEATGKWYMVVFYVATDLSQGYVLGSYEDEYRKVDGEWKIDGMITHVAYDTGGYHTQW